MLTTVVNIKDDPYDVYIGRGSLFGNPYRIGIDGNREEVIEKYKIRFYKLLKHQKFHSEVLKLEGKVLGCHCRPKKCHGDIIIEFLHPWED